MMTTRNLGGAVAAAALLACSGGGAGGGVPDSNAGAQQFCLDAWAALLDGLVRCGELGSAGAAYDEAQRATECAALRDSVAAGRVSYDAAQGAACVSAVSAATCAALTAPFDTTTCRTALAGKVQPGSACRIDVDCANGYCEFGASCPGTCVAYLALDADCLSGTCGPGLACNYDTMKCVTLTPGGEGEPCAQFDDAGDGCEPGLFCDWDAGRICSVQRISGTCWGDWQCEIGRRCTYRGGPDAGTCIAAAPTGGACLDSLLCQSDAYCAAGGTCAPLPRVGESCADSFECLDGYCDGTATCAAARAVGASCERDEECGFFGTCYDAQCVPSLCR